MTLFNSFGDLLTFSHSHWRLDLVRRFPIFVSAGDGRAEFLGIYTATGDELEAQSSNSPPLLTDPYVIFKPCLPLNLRQSH